MKQATLCAVSILLLISSLFGATPAPQAEQYSQMPTVLYGAAYYHEYMPYDRLDKDVELMKQSGINVVRMGESTWSLWEPEDGVFQYAWMDRVVDAMGKAGIKVIMGTPTYSIPVWMYQKHPEILARPMGGGEVRYGMRQNMNTDNPVFRFYAQRLIRKMVEHYRNNPTVIGWQIDNETGSYGATNHDVFLGYRSYLKKKFGTVENLNKAWGLNYWGQNVNNWEELPARDNATSTGYKLEWSRWSQERVSEYLAWQAALVREYRGPHQFVTHDHSWPMPRDVNEYAVAKSLDVVAMNAYHGTQKNMDGEPQALHGDFARSFKHGNYLVTETNAQSIGWDSAGQFPPYDGQLRLDVYTHLSNGANMVEYWHWHSIHSGQETYWKGVLSHDLEPNRAYAEVSRTAHELQKIGTHLVNLKIKNDVAILYSVDSSNGIDFMPFTSDRKTDYGSLVRQMHSVLYRANVGVDFIFPEEANFSDYKVVIVPALYIANDALLKKLTDYVKNGGNAVVTFKSGFCDEYSRVRWTRQPGGLREAAGLSYQEFSNLEEPLALKDDPYKADNANKASYWAEFLMPEHAQALAFYDHPFFSRWPAITRNQYGKGTLTYEGTYLSDAVQKAVLLDVVNRAGLTGADQKLPPSIRARHGVNSSGKRIHYYLNYSSNPVSFAYPQPAGVDLLTDKKIATGDQVELKPWDLVVVEE